MSNKDNPPDIWHFAFFILGILIGIEICIVFSLTFDFLVNVKRGDQVINNVYWTIEIDSAKTDSINNWRNK